MIYEFALEPELVAKWTSLSDCRYFRDSFAFGKGRIVSRCPKRWKKLVWNASVDADQHERKRLEVLIGHLSEQMVRRSNPNWDSNLGRWIDNAEREHLRCPFHAIIARTNSNNRPYILAEGDLDPDESALWATSDKLVVLRKSADLAKAVASLLQRSSHVIFVDPHFGPERLRYRRTFEAFLEQMVRQRPGCSPHRVEVHTAAKGTGTEEFFRKECETKLRGCVPIGITLLVRRLRETPQGEKLHNRYILTDIGGVTFGTGLDEGDNGQTDDLVLMDRRQYDLRWSQYGGDPPQAFEQEGDAIEVVGTRRLRK